MSKGEFPQLESSLAAQGSELQTQEIVFVKSKREPKTTERYETYITEAKKSQDKITESHWQRTICGDITARAELVSTSSANPEILPEYLRELQEDLAVTRGFKSENELIYEEVGPRGKTPRKARTSTPHQREFVNTTTIRIDFLDNSNKVRLVTLQENKITTHVRQKAPIGTDEVAKQRLNEYKKKLLALQEDDASFLSREKVITVAELKKARKRRRSTADISAKKILDHYLEDPDSPLDSEQKSVQAQSTHELSHLISHSHGGDSTVIPSTEAHNSRRIPIEILVPFFLKLGLKKISFETTNELMKDKNGKLTPLSNKEIIIITILEIQRRITFELDPLCPIIPVHGCYDIAKRIALLTLSGTDYFTPAKELLEKRGMRTSSSSTDNEATSSSDSESDRDFTLFPKRLSYCPKEKEPSNSVATQPSWL